MNIQENRIYKRKSDGKLCLVEKYNGVSIEGLFLDENCNPITGFTASKENFEKSAIKTPVKISNTAIVDGKEFSGKDSKVFYKNAVVCFLNEKVYGIDTLSLNENTAHNSMGRVVSETKSMGYADRYFYKVVSLKHKVL